MSEEEKRQNTDKSRIRIRVEHIFGFMSNSMKGMMIRRIGMVRAKFAIAMMNLVYNMCRYGFRKAARA